jgi:hypothetical protein
MLPRPTLIAATVAAALVTGTASAADVENFHAVFSGFSEVPAVLSEGHGTLDLRLENVDLYAHLLQFKRTRYAVAYPLGQSACGGRRDGVLLHESQ